jgi:NTE family protein
LEQYQSFGKADNNNLIVSLYNERFEFPVYEDFRQKYIYKSRFSTFDIKLQRTFGTNQAMGIGSSLDHYKLKPKVVSNEELTASNTYFSSYWYYRLNTLNRRNFSTRGWNILAKAGLVYNQKPKDYYFTFDSTTVAVDTIPFNNYQQAKLKVENFMSLSKRLTLLTQFNTAINFNYQDAYLNFINIGGINDFLRNQVPFVGLNEYTVNTNSVSVVMIGLQYQVLKNFYATLQTNAAVYDFVKRSDDIAISPKYLSGTAFSVGYDSNIGPISLSAMYSNQTRQVYGYVNIGFHF